MGMVSFFDPCRRVMLQSVLLLLLLPTVVLGADFGVADWGMSPDQVRALETDEPVPPLGGDILWYQTEFVGISAHRAYHFRQGKLVRGTLRLKAWLKVGRPQAVRDFEAVERHFVAIYGASSKPFSGDIRRHLSTWNAPRSSVNHHILKRAERYIHSVWLTPN